MRLPDTVRALVGPDAARPWAGAVAAALASICFGGMVFATRFVIAETDPLTLAFARFAIGGACLAPMLLGARAVPFSRGDLARCAGLGLVGFAVMSSLVGAGLRLVDASRGALILTAQSFLTLLLATWRREEPLTWLKGLGTGLAAAGLAVALSGPTGSSLAGTTTGIGDLAMFAAALCVSIYSVYTRPLLRRHPPLQLTAISSIAGAAALAPAVAVIALTRGLPRLSALGWVAVIYVGTFGAAVGYGLWAWALARTSPSRVAVFLALNPLTAMALGGLLLREEITLRYALGLVLVVAGILATNRPDAGRGGAASAVAGPPRPGRP